LFEELGRLRQSVKTSGSKPARNQVVSGAFGRAGSQTRGFNFYKILTVEEIANLGKKAMPKNEIASWPVGFSQVQVPIFVPDGIRRIGFFIKRERRWLRRIQDFQFIDEDFDFACNEFQVNGFIGT
jgi:hypothetical protein